MPVQPVGVLHLVPDLDMGGHGRLLLDLLSRLDPDVFRITVATTGTESGEVPAFAAAGVRVLRWGPGLHPYGNLRQRWACVRALRDAIRRQNPQIVHTHGRLHNVYGCLAARLAGVPHIMAHDHEALCGSRRERLPIAWSARWLDVTFVPSRLGAEARQELARRTATRVLHLPTGVDLRHFAPPAPAERRSARRQYGFEDGQFVVGSVGSWWERKHFELLLQAWPTVREHVPGAQLLLVGDGPERARLQREVARLGITSHVWFTGWVEDVLQAYRSLDAYVTLAEPPSCTGLALAEALACGLPVVARDNALVREIAGAKSARVVEARPRAVAQALVDLARSPAESRSLAARAREHALANLDIERSARRLEEVYAHCVARIHRPRHHGNAPPPGFLRERAS